jgi:hypothetical protein
MIDISPANLRQQLPTMHPEFSPSASRLPERIQSFWEPHKCQLRLVETAVQLLGSHSNRQSAFVSSIAKLFEQAIRELADISESKTTRNSVKRGKGHDEDCQDQDAKKSREVGLLEQNCDGDGDGDSSSDLENWDDLATAGVDAEHFASNSEASAVPKAVVKQIMFDQNATLARQLSAIMWPQVFEQSEVQAAVRPNSTLRNVWIWSRPSVSKFYMIVCVEIAYPHTISFLVFCKYMRMNGPKSMSGSQYQRVGYLYKSARKVKCVPQFPQIISGCTLLRHRGSQFLNQTFLIKWWGVAAAERNPPTNPLLKRVATQRYFQQILKSTKELMEAASNFQTYRSRFDHRCDNVW